MFHSTKTFADAKGLRDASQIRKKSLRSQSLNRLRDRDHANLGDTVSSLAADFTFCYKLVFGHVKTRSDVFK